VTAVSASRATREEQRRAYQRGEAARIAGSLDAALVPAVETGKVLLLRGWGWTRERERLPLVSPEAAASPARPARLRTFELALREAGSGRPLMGVPLEVVTPEGDERGVTTDGAGRVRLHGLAPGACHVRSAIDDARVETSYVATAGRAAPTASAAIEPAHLVEVERHRVRSGETLEDIAAAHDVPWERIARFNWGTTDAVALERAYRETVGSRPGRDGHTRFDDGDDPGVLLVPRPWTARLSVGAHELFVAPLRPLFLRLENDAGLALPGAHYCARFADGSERTGALGSRGIARLDGVPDGPFTIAYPDELELLATSLAASVRRALAEGETAPLFTLLMQNPEVLARARAVYERDFDDLTGRGLAADIDQAITDPDARRPLLGLCALSGLEVEGVNAVAVATSPRRPAAS
jgi:hypothetical protein